MKKFFSLAIITIFGIVSTPIFAQTPSGPNSGTPNTTTTSSSSTTSATTAGQGAAGAASTAGQGAAGAASTAGQGAAGAASTANQPPKCNGIKLNTNVPFVGNCIEFSSSDTGSSQSISDDTTKVTALNAFPILASGLMKILLTAILVIGLAAIILGGVMIAYSGADSSYYNQGKNLIRAVITGIAIIGISGVILNLINPNFFK